MILDSGVVFRAVLCCAAGPRLNASGVKIVIQAGSPDTVVSSLTDFALVADNEVHRLKIPVADEPIDDALRQLEFLRDIFYREPIRSVGGTNRFDPFDEPPEIDEELLTHRATVGVR
jgi:hypothetical protein